MSESTRRVIRVALIGYGRAGRTFHTPLIRSTPGFDLAVVASSRADAVRVDLPHVSVVASPAEAWTAAGVDVVVIATPNDTHVPLAAAALDAGKHVVVDKPVALTVDDARRLAALASERGRLLAGFQNRRWDGDFLALEQLVRDGALGEVSHVESHFDRFRPHVRDRWRERPGAGSGVWYDLGPHLADQALRLFGLPEWVSGHLAAHRQGARSDDWAHVILGYAGRAVVLHASMLVAAHRPRFIVHGSRASWTKYGTDPQEFDLAARMGEDLGPSPRPESAVMVEGATGLETSGVVPAGNYGRFYEALRHAVLGDGKNPVPPADIVALTAVVETAARSASVGHRLPLTLTAEERLACDRERS